MPLPKYQSHKVVGAARIIDIQPKKKGGALLILDYFDSKDPNGAPTRVKVSSKFVKKHEPRIGGYFVEYPDGYCSWSPKEAFESGYSRVIIRGRQMVDQQETVELPPIPTANPDDD